MVRGVVLVATILLASCGADSLEERIHYCPFSPEDMVDTFQLFTGLWAERFGEREAEIVSYTLYNRVHTHCIYTRLYWRGQEVQGLHKGGLFRSDIYVRIPYTARYPPQASSIFHELTHASLLAINGNSGGATHDEANGWTQGHDELIEEAKALGLEYVLARLEEDRQAGVPGWQE